MYNIVLSVLAFSHGHSFFFFLNLSWAFEPRSVPTGALLGFRARTGSRLAPDSVIFIIFFFLRIKWLARGRLVNVSVIPGRGEIARRRTDQLKRADGLAVLNGVAARHDVERDYLGTEQAGFWAKSSGVRMKFESGVAPLDSYLEKTASEFCRDVFMPEPRIMGITVFKKKNCFNLIVTTLKPCDVTVAWRTKHTRCGFRSVCRYVKDVCVCVYII